MGKISSKYLGNTYDGWTVNHVDIVGKGGSHYRYVLTQPHDSTYNVVNISCNTMARIARGEKRISNVVANKTTLRQQRAYRFQNTVLRDVIFID